MASNGNSSNSNGCPVAKDSTSTQHSEAPSRSSGWNWGGTTTTTTSNNNNNNTSGCPVSQDQPPTVASVEEAAGYSQAPHPAQQGVALSTHRMVSSIPRGVLGDDDKGPSHQPTLQQQQEEEAPSPLHWVYPSEQQFFHALRKKGWDHVPASTIPSVLEIHNTINERTWKQVEQWERDMDLPSSSTATTTIPPWIETDLKLVRFQGRPKDLSPKAFLWTKLLPWNEPPFDRHDWYVQKQPRNGTTTTPPFPIQRYVIDYYMLPPSHPDLPPTPYVDARPALDSPRAFLQRAGQWLWNEEVAALAAEYVDWKAQQPRYYDGHGPYLGKENTKTKAATTEAKKESKSPTDKKTKATS